MLGDYLRRGAAEFVGTFALVFIGGGAIAFARTFTDIGLAHGLVIAVMASAVGHISGGHFNPAVTLGFLVTRRMNPVLAAVYWIVQFGAAVLAALLLAGRCRRMRRTGRTSARPLSGRASMRARASSSRPSSRSS